MPKILVVDDEPNYRRVLTLLLRQAGYEPVAVADAEAALALLASAPVALVLSDLRLTGRDGLGLWQAVRQQFGPIPFILMTAYDDQALCRELAARGIGPCLTKPFANDAVLQRVADALAAGVPAHAELPDCSEPAQTPA